MGSRGWPIDPCQFQWSWATWMAGREGSNFCGWSG